MASTRRFSAYLPRTFSVVLLVVVAFSAPSAHAAPTTAPTRPRPTMGELMGINGHTVQFKPETYAPVCRRVRDYHPMGWDVAEDPAKATTFPFAANRVDWSQVYGSWTKAGFDVDASIMFDGIKPDAWKDPAQN